MLRNVLGDFLVFVAIQIFYAPHTHITINNAVKTLSPPFAFIWVKYKKKLVVRASYVIYEKETDLTNGQYLRSAW